MHYFKWRISDYASHTQHLDESEDLAYRRMLDWYYLHESPLPESVDQIARLIRMRTQSEAIANVLQEFFELGEYGYIQKAADKEINAYKAKSEKAKASAAARWSAKPNKSDANALRDECEGNANHKPLTNNHKPVNKDKPSSAKADSIPYIKIAELWNNTATNLPKIGKPESMSADRKKLIKRFWNAHKGNFEEGKAGAYFANYFAAANSTDFWVETQATIDTLMRPNKYENIMKG